MSTSPRPSACPGSDDLSAAVDGSVPEEIAVHLETCAQCQRDLATLRRLDAVLRAHLAPPPGLADRIRQRVHEAAAATPPVVAARWWLSPLLRLAAAVVITAAAVAFLARLLKSGAGPGENTIVETKTFPNAPEPTIRRVSADPRRAPVQADGSVRAPQNLPRAIRHVWTVGNAADQRDRLQAMLPKGSYEVGTAEGNTVFTVRLTDRDLQTLVDRLAADSTWQLASPDLPQPRKPGSVALTGHDVHYSLVLVESGATQP